MTKEALNKLSEKQMKYCTTLSVLIAKDKESKREHILSHDVGKLRGYLECLNDIGLIKKYEMRALFLWFSEKDRSN